jgi:hypothetical protein
MEKSFIRNVHRAKVVGMARGGKVMTTPWIKASAKFPWPFIAMQLRSAKKKGKRKKSIAHWRDPWM